MKIAVYDSLPNGGARRAVHAVLERLSHTHEVLVYTLHAEKIGFCDLEDVARSVKRFPYCPTPPFKFPWSRFYSFWQLADLRRFKQTLQEMAEAIDADGADIAYLPSCSHTEVPFLPLYLNTPSVYHAMSLVSNVHPLESRDYLKPKRAWIRKLLPDAGYRRLQRRMESGRLKSIRRTSKVVTISRFMREYLYREYGVNAKVLPPCVDSLAFTPANGVVRENLVLSVGSMEPRKAHDFVVRSVAQIPADRRPVVGIVYNVDSERERGYVAGLAKNLGVTVEWHAGISTAAGMRDLYNRAGVVCCASIMEALGLVPLEAAACGAPVVAVAEGGLRETVLDGETGLLVDRDEADCAQAIERLLKDRELARRLGARGREHVLQSWNWDKVMIKLEQALIETARPVSSNEEKRP